MIDVYLLFGGPSSEHDIALRSALNISKNLNKEKYNLKLVYINKEGCFSKAFAFEDTSDEFSLVKEINFSKAESIGNFIDEIKSLDPKNTVIIPAIHGTYGEDGTIQGFLDVLGFPYVGNGLLSSAICMDKVTSNDIFYKNGFLQAKYLYTYKEGFDEKFLERCENEIGFPLIVKPSANGSSVGVNKVENKDQLAKAIDEALKYDDKALVEELIVGQEIEIAVIGEKDNILATKPAAYITDHIFLDYDAKYFDKQTIEELPYKMDPKDEEKAREFAKECYKACGCSGFARVDIFYSKDKKLYINEINTFPGFTPSSFFARLAMLSYDEDFSYVLDQIIEDGLRRFDDK